MSKKSSENRYFWEFFKYFFAVSRLSDRKDLRLGQKTRKTAMPRTPKDPSQQKDKPGKTESNPQPKMTISKTEQAIVKEIAQFFEAKEIEIMRQAFRRGLPLIYREYAKQRETLERLNSNSILRSLVLRAKTGESISEQDFVEASEKANIDIEVVKDLIAGYVTLIEKRVRNKEGLSCKSLVHLLHRHWGRLIECGGISIDRLQELKDGSAPTRLEIARIALCLEVTEEDVESVVKRGKLEVVNGN